MIRYESFKTAFTSFNLAYVSKEDAENNKNLDKIAVNDFIMTGFQNGYLITNDSCSAYSERLLVHLRFNPNTTFYKAWEDVVSKDRVELLIDQILHYITTYGPDGVNTTGDTTSNGYVPNDNPAVVDYTKWTVIFPASLKEIADKCFNLAKSGIAMNAETVDMCINFISEYLQTVDKDAYDIGEIRTKEVLVGIALTTGIRPKNPVELLRYLVSERTESNLLIKNKEMFVSIVNGRVKSSLSKLTDVEIDSLASIFYRFKMIFLAFKKIGQTESVIVNKIRRKAVKLHKPMKVGFFEDVLNPKWCIPAIDDKVCKIVENEKNPFKIIRAINTLDEYLNNFFSKEDYARTFIIRNGKSYTRVYKGIDNTFDQNKFKNVLALRTILYFVLTNRLTKDAVIPGKHRKVVMMSDKFSLACPVSEKMFIGNLPYGSYYNLRKNNYMGVYWRGEWGTQDFDLSFCSFDGRKYGWNADYYNAGNNIVFSGDMTSANPEATEMFFSTDEMPDGLLNLNRYNGREGSQARMFFGSDDLSKDFRRNYMVDPNTIELKFDLVSEKKEQIVGVVLDKRYYCINVQTSNSRVSSNTPEYLNGLRRKLLSYMSLETLLTDAGYVVVHSLDELQKIKETEMTEISAVPDYDFTDPTKDMLIKFFMDVYQQLEEKTDK